MFRGKSASKSGSQTTTVPGPVPGGATPVRAAPPPPPNAKRASVPPQPARPKTPGVWAVTVTTFAMAVATFAVAALGARNLAFALLVGLFGFGHLLLGVYQLRVDFRGWGGALFLDLFMILVALGSGNLWMFAPILASLACLYVFRLDFGVGAWRLEEKEKDAARTEMERRHTANPYGTRCPRCGSVRLWSGDDGSAVCLECRTGYTRLAGAPPMPSGNPGPPPPPP